MTRRCPGLRCSLISSTFDVSKYSFSVQRGLNLFQKGWQTLPSLFNLDPENGEILQACGALFFFPMFTFCDLVFLLSENASSVFFTWAVLFFSAAASAADLKIIYLRSFLYSGSGSWLLKQRSP